jgi:hypothetical protein
MDSTKRLPLAPTGIAGLFLSFLAIGLAVWGSILVSTSMNFTRQPLAEGSATLIYTATMIAPMLLGAIAFILGILTPRLVEKSGGKKAGQGPATFAMLIGMLAFVVGFVSTFVVLIYPKLT